MAGKLPDCENLNSEVVRYLRCKDIGAHLEQAFSVQATFKDEWGKAQLFLTGSEQARLNARAMIKAEQRHSKSFKVPALALSRLRKCHDPECEVMLDMRKRQLNVGWSINLKSEKLTICCGNEEDINETLSILLANIEIPYHDIANYQMEHIPDKSAINRVPSKHVVTSASRKQDALADQLKQQAPSLLPITDQDTVPDTIGGIVSTDKPQPQQESEQQLEAKIHLTLDQMRFIDFNSKKLNFVQMNNEIFGVDVYLDKPQCVVGFRDGIDSVASAQADFKRSLDNLTQKSFEKSTEFILCLSKEVKFSEIKASLKHAQARVGWDIRDGKLWLCGDNDSSVQRAETAICGLIFIGVFPEAGCLTGAQSQSLSSTDKWKRFENEVSKKHPTIRLLPVSDYSQIVFTMRMDDSSDLVSSTLTTFFRSIKFHQAELSISENFSKLIGCFKEYIQNECSPEDEKIALDLTESMCIVSSLSPGSVEHAKTCLLDMEENVIAKNIEVSSRAQVDWLASEDGTSRLMEICSKSNTIGSLTNDVEDFLLSKMINVRMGDISDIVMQDGDCGVFCCQGTTSTAVRELVASTKPLRLGIQHFNTNNQSTYVYAAKLPNLQTDDSHMQVLKDEVGTALDKFSVNEVEKVVFPAVGTGKLNYSMLGVADAMFGAVYEHLSANPDTSIRQVSLVIYYDHSLCETFKERLTQWQSPLRGSEVGGFKSTVIEVLGFREVDVDEAIASLKNDLKRLILTDDWSNSPLREWITNLTEDERTEIKQLASETGIGRIEFSSNNIWIEGSHGGIKQTRDLIDKILLKIESDSKSLVPPTWDKSMVSGYSQVIVDENANGEEYQKVSTAFHRTCGHRVKMHEVIRIQNEHLYLQYQTQKKKVEREVQGNMVVERPLWHGTDPETTFKICKSEFNRSFAGKNATRYGQGSYFSSTAKYSIKFTDEDDQRYRYIILAKVLTGHYRLGSPSISVKNVGEGYHSTVDDEKNPTKYVVYHDAAAYPEYVITFRVA